MHERDPLSEVQAGLLEKSLAKASKLFRCSGLTRGLASSSLPDQSSHRLGVVLVLIGSMSVMVAQVHLEQSGRILPERRSTNLTGAGDFPVLDFGSRFRNTCTKYNGLE